MEQANLVSLRRKTRYTAVFLGLVLALCVITVLNINIGSVPISVGEIAKIIFTKAGDPTQVNIIWKIRLPRILMAALLGGALSLAGFLLQTFFSNPIAGPFVLGIKSNSDWKFVHVYTEMLTPSLIQMHPTCTQIAP